MINLQKLNLYRKYGGDSDGLERCGTEKEKTIINSEEWSLLSDNLQSLEMIKKGVTSQNFSNEIISKLKKSCDDDTFKLLTAEISITL